jgi:hypothetical protein
MCHVDAADYLPNSCPSNNPRAPFTHMRYACRRPGQHVFSAQLLPCYCQISTLLRPSRAQATKTNELAAATPQTAATDRRNEAAGRGADGQARQLRGDLVRRRGGAAAPAARARRRGTGVAVAAVLGARAARAQVSGRGGWPRGSSGRVRARGPRRRRGRPRPPPPRGAQHARSARLGLPLVGHGRRAAGRRLHGAALPLPALRRLLRGRRRQGLHGRRHLARPRQLHTRARHRTLPNSPPPRSQRTRRPPHDSLPNRWSLTPHRVGLAIWARAQITSLFCGDPVRPPLLLLGITGTTFFVSMWIHNTACTVMMMPVATGILQRLPRGVGGAGAGTGAHDEVRRFSKAVVLGVVYASAIGGMATLAGTGVNIILVGMWSTYFPEQEPITFSSWMSFGLPMALILFLALWITLCLMFCSNNTGKALSGYLDRSHLRRELSLLGSTVSNTHFCFYLVTLSFLKLCRQDLLYFTRN